LSGDMGATQVSAGNRLYRGRAAAGGLDGSGRDELPASSASMRSAWRKSSYSACNGNCVEVAELQPDLICVRDTKDVGRGPVLVFEAAAWRSFLDSIKKGS
jgi:uncharacterized protein DUF397